MNVGERAGVADVGGGKGDVDRDGTAEPLRELEDSCRAWIWVCDVDRPLVDATRVTAWRPNIDQLLIKNEGVQLTRLDDLELLNSIRIILPSLSPMSLDTGSGSQISRRRRRRNLCRSPCPTLVPALHQPWTSLDPIQVFLGIRHQLFVHFRMIARLSLRESVNAKIEYPHITFQEQGELLHELSMERKVVAGGLDKSPLDWFLAFKEGKIAVVVG
jgi:hypothetical protein